MGGDVQFFPFNKTLILQLQLDTPPEGKGEGGGESTHAGGINHLTIEVQD